MQNLFLIKPFGTDQTALSAAARFVLEVRSCNKDRKIAREVAIEVKEMLTAGGK